MTFVLSKTSPKTYKKISDTCMKNEDTFVVALKHPMKKGKFTAHSHLAFHARKSKKNGYLYIPFVSAIIRLSPKEIDEYCETIRCWNDVKKEID